MVYCSACSKNVAGVRPFDGALCCNMCGKVLEDYHFSTEVTFFKDASGQSKAAGTMVNSMRGMSDSRERTLDKAYDEMKHIKDGLRIDDYSDDLVITAKRFYEIALERNFTRGRRSELVYAACLYLACRVKNKPFLLIDFSDFLSINVYEIGAVYMQLCYVLYLANDKNDLKLVDPSIFIHKFTNLLLPPEAHDKVGKVIKTARDIIASMKRDWMQTGRKPSGLCGAALYIAALSHGLKCSKSDVIKVVHICEATLTKRLVEFENTDSGSLTIEEFMQKERDIRDSNLTSHAFTSLKESGTNEVLCEHSGQKLFAYGLCRDCYEDFMKVSGGLEGGSNPPAFQRAERERLAAESTAAENAYGASGSQLPSKNEKPENITTEQAVDDELDSFSDIDDSEVDGYLHNEEEKRYKKIIWEEMNREYLEEQAAKEAAIAAAREACMANFDQCPEDLQAAQELAAAAAAAVAKSKKEKQQKRAAEAKNSAPAQTAAEAAKRMLMRKRLSSRINYDALDKLFGESVEPGEHKKQRAEPHSDEVEKMSKVDKEECTLKDNFEADGYKDGGYARESYDNGIDCENVDDAYDYDYDDNNEYAYDGF